MKMLLSVVAVAGLSISCDVHSHVHAMLSHESGAPKSAAASVAGQWQLSMQTPQGSTNSVMKWKQDGVRITGTCDMDRMGSLALTGTVDEKHVSFTMTRQDGRKLTFSGVMTGNKITGTTDPDAGAWTATRI